MTKEEITEWTPKQGEMIEVRDHDNSEWRVNEFLYQENRADQKYVCFEKGLNCVFSWRQARPINQLRTEIEALEAKIKELEAKL